MNDQPPWDRWQAQRRPQQPNGHQRYGQKPYPQGTPQYGQPGPGHYEGQPPYQRQRYGPPGTRRPYSRPGYGFGPQLPQRRRKRYPRNIFSGTGALIVAIIVIAVLWSYGTGSGAGVSASNPAAADSANSPAATNSSPLAAPTQAVTVMTFTGSGQENTPWFTVTSTWKLVYSFNCANFGQSGNFQASEDGGTDVAVSIDDMAMSKSGSTWAYNDGGTHYLQINSECAWKVKIADEA